LAIEEKRVASENTVREKETVAQEETKADQARGRDEDGAEPNRLIYQSLTPEVLQYQAIDRLADKIQIALIP
jgi:hypothetical protein